MMDKKIPQPDAQELDPKGAVSSKNKLNDLTAKEWIPETVTVWRQKGLGPGHPQKSTATWSPRIVVVNSRRLPAGLSHPSIR
jgi:hypothetical protein